MTERGGWRCAGLSPSFLRIGVTAASLSDWGTEPELREELMISVMSGGGGVGVARLL